MALPYYSKANQTLRLMCWFSSKQPLIKTNTDNNVIEKIVKFLIRGSRTTMPLVTMGLIRTTIKYDKWLC